MSLQHVQQALVSAASAALAGIPCEFENVAFTKPTSAKWAKLTFLPNDPTVDTLGTSGQDKADGLLQIDLNYPQNSGDADAREDFEDVRASFPAGARFVSVGQEVSIQNCGRSQGRIVDQWYRVSITIYWYAYIPR